MEQIPGYGVAASSGGPTTPSTTTTEAPEYEVPPLGLTLPDFSNWNLPPPETPQPRGLPAASGGLPCIGRLDMIRQVVGKHNRVQEVAGLWAPGQRALALPMSVLCTPQVAPPLHQPRPSSPATPYQQAVQPPRRSMGRGVAAKLPSDRAAPMAGQPTQNRGRQQASQRLVSQSPQGCTRDNIKCSLDYHLRSHPVSTKQHMKRTHWWTSCYCVRLF